MSKDWQEENYLDFKELEEQITKFFDKSDYDETLRIQLNELEMLESMFPNPGEFSIYDYSVIADINDFLDGKTSLLPPCLDFNINLVIGDNIKLEVCVNLPHDYPTSEPDIFVRNDALTRNQQHELNADLAMYISTLDHGEICICSAISWLQENAMTYFNKTNNNKINKKRPIPVQVIDDTKNDNKVFMRYWIYSHHIYSKIKRREILDLAQEYNITGFCLPGRPGIICGEGWNVDCEDWWQKVKYKTYSTFYFRPINKWA